MARRTSMWPAVAALVMVTACGGSSGTPIAAGSGTTTTTTEATTTTVAAPGTTTTAKATTSGSAPAPTVRVTAPTTTTTQAPATTTTARPRPKVKLPTGGPRGPVDPPDTPAYQLLTKGASGCQALYDEIKAEWGNPSGTSSGNRVSPSLTYLYRGAAQACLLRWAEAKADFDRLQALGTPSFGNTCSDEEAGVRYCERCHRLVLQWLTGQLAAYKTDPAYAPVYEADTTSPSPCPTASTTTTTVRR